MIRSYTHSFAAVLLSLVLENMKQELENQRATLVDVYARFAALTDTQLSGNCFSDKPKNTNRVRNKLLPKIQDDLDATGDAIAVIDLALGDANVTNQDILNRFSSFRDELMGLPNTGEGRARLSEIYVNLGAGFVLDAQTLKEGLKNIRKTMASLTDAVCADNDTPPDGWVPRYNACVKESYSSLRITVPAQCTADATP